MDSRFLIERRTITQGLLAGAALLACGATQAANTAAADEGRIRRVKLNAARIHYREWGSRSSPPLVLLHPAPFNSHIWTSLGPALT
jgi:hypothetical protein